MHGVAAEVAQEVVVFFQNNDVDSGARQQQRMHEARRTATGNTDLGSQNSGHERRSPPQAGGGIPSRIAARGRTPTASLRSASSPARVTPRPYPRSADSLAASRRTGQPEVGTLR